MSIRYVLCPVSGGDEDAPALRVAIAAAEPFGAHVRALFVRPSVSAAIPYLGEGLTGAVVENIVSAANKAADESLALARRNVEAAAAAAHAPEGRVSLREATGLVEEEIAAAARLADLVVYAADADGSIFPEQSATEHTLLQARRPVLIAPRRPIGSLGTKVAILWDGGVPAAAAVMAGLPFIEKAQSVEIIHMSGEDDPAAALEDVADALKVRGIHASTRVIERQGRKDGERLAEAALAAEADLVVMGGYGHSRLREVMLGGVTRHMLRNASIPVLMAH